MLPASEFRILDINSAFLGISVETLMEQAGCAVADLVMERYPGSGRVAVVCGSGNNGGDGFVAARHLIPYRDVDVLMVKPPSTIRTEASKRNFQLVSSHAIEYDDADLDSYDVVMDAVLGVGIRGEVTEPLASVLDSINAVSGAIVSVDVPSGLGTPQAVNPDVTVTFHDVKEGMDWDNSGDIIVADIGIPAEAERFTGPGEAQLFPQPQLGSHKGQNGRLLVIGGGPYTGAPALASMAAYRSGCDLVRVAAPSSVRSVIASYSPMIITSGFDGDMLEPRHVDDALRLASGTDTVLIGPGLGNDPSTLDACLELIEACSTPMVVDADAIVCLRGAKRAIENPPAVLTPHRRELEDLTGSACPDDIEERSEYVRVAAEAIGATVLLKGQVDVISDGSRIKLNRTGHCAMTVGGTGDVLAGIVAGLLSKGCSPFDAARLGAFINGMAGERAFLAHGYGLMATDLLDHIGLSIVNALEFGRGI